MAGQTVMIAGGGTGGHVFPGVAVAQELVAMLPELEVVFVGTERGLESRAIPPLGFALETLNVRYVKGTGLWGWTRGALLLPGAGFGAMSLLRRWKPSVVISVGGYAAGPMTVTAATLGYRTALMEQNARSGMTNRLLGKVVDRCFVTFEGTEGLPASRCVLVGNPVRRQILEARARVEHREGAQEFRILVTGGSGGAGSMNAELPQILRSLPEELGRRVTIRHQAGRGRHAPVLESYQGFVGRAEVVEFIDDMAEAYLWADLVVCRAGATTLSELLVLGKPALYIPFPNAADNHQEKNARAIVEAGAGVMLLDAELSGDKGVRLLSGLIRNPTSLHNMSEQAVKLGRPDAGREIAESIVELAGLGPVGSQRAA